MGGNYTAVVRRDGRSWIGWIEEVPGVNSQGKTRVELLDNLRSALKEMLEINRSEALAAMEGDYEEVSIEV
jgi:predicted RNase H-like HicB family nuclease